MASDAQQPTRLPEVRTDRLVVRELTAGDLRRYGEVTDAAWGRKAPTGRHRRQLAWTTRAYAGLADVTQPPYGDRAVVLSATAELVGLVGLVPSLGPFAALLDGARHSHFSPEVGLFWLVDPAYQGRGYATEAATALVGQAFSQFNLARVVATTEYANIASQRVMQRLAMTIHRWARPQPPWFQAVGVADRPTTAR